MSLLLKSLVFENIDYTIQKSYLDVDFYELLRDFPKILEQLSPFDLSIACQCNDDIREIYQKKKNNIVVSYIRMVIAIWSILLIIRFISLTQRIFKDIKDIIRLWNSFGQEALNQLKNTHLLRE